MSKKVPLKGNMFQDRTYLKDWVISVPPNACVASVSTNGGFGAESFSNARLLTVKRTIIDTN